MQFCRAWGGEHGGKDRGPQSDRQLPTTPYPSVPLSLSGSLVLTLSAPPKPASYIIHSALQGSTLAISPDYQLINLFTQ
ncbi:hypothetical protein AAFF_G00092620 [Aldrovandia affinis]|uniref:Uncharacterized protein n=1 Tax=Aldrovandia affinis TaxID=143900 RepID=A0AAD7T2Q7_9TELE|nr:hypothetical protein AAFF_G00092620 [Aldrovandia affinis]